MSIVYQDPFNQIVDLHRVMNGSAVLLPVFLPGWGDEGSYETPPSDFYIAEPSMTQVPWTSNFQQTWYAEIWLFLVPRFTDLTASQRGSLSRNDGTVWFVPSSGTAGYRGRRHDSLSEYAQFATPEEGIAYSLRMSVSSIRKFTKVADATFQRKALSVDFGTSTQFYVADDYSNSNVPWFTNPKPRRDWADESVDPPKSSYTISPAELSNSLPISFSNATHSYDEKTSIMLTNTYSRVTRSAASGVEQYLVIATGTTAVGPSSGQAQYEAQRALATTLEGSIYYSRY